ncbi:MAG: hypothetical protein ACPGVC_04380 [Salibacteraceae bacterium]
MAFTQNQLYFAIFFFVIFVAIMIYAYRSDLKRLGPHADGALKVLGLIIIVMIIFYGTVKFLAS